MLLTPDALDVLHRALRARPATVEGLRDLVELDGDAFEAALDVLAQSGCLKVDQDGSLSCTPPTMSVGSLLMAEIERQRSESDANHRARLEDIRVLQSLARDWAVGAAPGAVVSAELIHGPMAARDAAELLFNRRGPVSSLAVLPDVSSLERPPPEFLDGFVSMLQQKPEVDRILLGSFDGADADLSETLAVFRAAGTEFRTHPRLPSWFAVDADDTVLFPYAWGETWPTSVLIVSNPAIAGAARSLFERLWRQAQAVFDDDPSWMPLLRLMAAGATTEGAARSLGLSPRTARRRLQAAMQRHGATTLFDLGVAVGGSLRSDRA